MQLPVSGSGGLQQSPLPMLASSALRVEIHSTYVPRFRLSEETEFGGLTQVFLDGALSSLYQHQGWPSMETPSNLAESEGNNCTPE
jgi:hypothetical protein